MRVRGMLAGVAFAAALLAIYWVRSAGWPQYVVLVLAVSMLGGYLIGRWWAVAVSLGTNIVFLALYLPAYEYVFKITSSHNIGREAAVLVGHTILSAAATAVGIWTRRRRLARPLPRST